MSPKCQFSDQNFSLLYINDWPENVQSQVRLSDDDRAVYLAVGKQNDRHQLQDDLDQHQKWEELWDMEYNRIHCVELYIKRARNPINIQYTLHDQTRDTVDTVTYMHLGVDISCNLNFKQHINRITENANKSRGFFKRNIRTKNPGVHEAAYQTLLRPQVEYASTTQSPYTNQDIKKAEMVQRMAISWTMKNYSS